MYKYVFKRWLDIMVSLMAMPFVISLFLIVAPLIWLDDPGPIFYNAPRLGYRGKEFKMYKFRSMKVNAPDIRNSDGSTFNSDQDPRVTRIGRLLRKTSIDEMPQFINVLLGDMSIVGPRPATPKIKEILSKKHCRRFAVKPGITGYSQAYFRNSIPFNDKMEYDLYYIEHLSFIMDIKIIYQTFISVLKRKNINQNTDSGMSKKSG